MPIVREPIPKKDFFVAPREFTRDQEMPYEAIGLLSVLYSLPADWEYSAAGLAKRSMHGKNRISKLMRLLVEKGYVEMVQQKTADGKFAGKSIRLKNNSSSSKDTKKCVQIPLSENTAPQSPSPDFTEPVSEEQYNRHKDNIHEDKRHQSINLSEDEIDEIREDVKDQIDYDYACKEFGKGRIDSVVDIIMEVYLSVGTVCIEKHQLPAAQVKNIFRKIDVEHLRYVFDCIDKTSRGKEINNTKGYLLTALYNAPMTIDLYYDAQVNYDMNKDGGED